MTYRYYLGLSLPPEISDTISSIQRELFDPHIARQPLEPHITLLPPPAVERIDPRRLAEQAKTVAEDFLPLELTLTDVTTFDRRAIVVAVESATVHKLQAQLTQLLPAESQPQYFPTHSFHPHVTLNQAVPGKKLPASLYEAYQQQLSFLLPAVVSVPHLTLYRWLRPRHYEAHTL